MFIVCVYTWCSHVTGIRLTGSMVKIKCERHHTQAPLVPSSFGGGGSWSDENCTQNAAGARCRCRRASDGHTSHGQRRRRRRTTLRELFSRASMYTYVYMNLGPVLWHCISQPYLRKNYQTLPYQAKVGFKDFKRWVFSGLKFKLDSPLHAFSNLLASVLSVKKKKLLSFSKEKFVLLLCLWRCLCVGL